MKNLLLSCVCSFYVLYHSSTEGGMTQALSSECKIEQAYFTDWMPFLTSNLMEEIRPNPDS